MTNHPEIPFPDFDLKSVDWKDLGRTQTKRKEKSDIENLKSKLAKSQRLVGTYHSNFIQLQRKFNQLEKQLKNKP